MPACHVFLHPQGGSQGARLTHSHERQVSVPAGCCLWLRCRMRFPAADGAGVHGSRPPAPDKVCVPHALAPFAMSAVCHLPSSFCPSPCTSPAPSAPPPTFHRPPPPSPCVQYHYVLQSLTLWREISHEVRLGCASGLLLCTRW